MSGEPPNSGERRGAAPEDAEEMTRQRRVELGLKEEGELTPDESQEIESDIEDALGRLYSHNFEELSPELQEEWYCVEMEAKIGRDRESALAVLNKFLFSFEGRDEEKKE